MPFNKETARLAGKKSKRGKAKKLDPTVKDKMEILYEEVLDHLIMHQKAKATCIPVSTFCASSISDNSVTHRFP